MVLSVAGTGPEKHLLSFLLLKQFGKSNSIKIQIEITKENHVDERLFIQRNSGRIKNKLVQSEVLDCHDITVNLAVASFILLSQITTAGGRQWGSSHRKMQWDGCKAK